MNDADAEAILNALGSSLQWNPYYAFALKSEEDDGFKKYVNAGKAYIGKKLVSRSTVSLIAWCDEDKNTVEFAVTPSATYSIRVRRRLWKKDGYTAGFSIGDPLQFGSHPQTFKHIADAKAACERHYVTGEWQ